MTGIQFNHDFAFEYGKLTQVAPKIRRIVANNPSPFTGPGTGTYIIGEGEVGVIDPGPMMPDHVKNMLDGLGDETVGYILVTHTHSDHSPAARLLAEQTHAPIFAFGPHSKESAGALEGGVDRDFVPDFTLVDGECIGNANWQLQAIHTPGHCSNHLCFAFPEASALFCGDQLMAWSTTVIMPPDGSVKDYLNSLQQLEGRVEKTFYPTHGAPIPNPGNFIFQIKQHRLERMAQISDAIRDDSYSLSQIRERVYPEIRSSLYAGAELSILASLEYLIDEGKVCEENHNDPKRYRLLL